MTAPQDQIQQWADLANAATEGPWRVGAEGSEGSRVNPDTGDKRWDSRYVLTCNGRVQPEDGRNAEFVAASRVAVPAMAKALQAVIEQSTAYDNGQQLPLPMAVMSAERQKCWRFGVKWAATVITEALGVQA